MITQIRRDKTKTQAVKIGEVYEERKEIIRTVKEK